MYRFDASRLDLAREYKARPFGEHSPDLQYLLNLMRTRETDGTPRAGDDPAARAMDAGAAHRQQPGAAAADKHRHSTAWKPPNGQCSNCAGRRWRARRCQSNDNTHGLRGRDQRSPRRDHRLQGELRWRRHYNARIVRLLSPEAGPEAPPFRTEPVERHRRRQLSRADAAIARGLVGDGAAASIDRRTAQLFHCRPGVADAARRWTAGHCRNLE